MQNCLSDKSSKENRLKQKRRTSKLSKSTYRPRWSTMERNCTWLTCSNPIYSCGDWLVGSKNVMTQTVRQVTPSLKQWPHGVTEKLPWPRHHLYSRSTTTSLPYSRRRYIQTRHAEGVGNESTPCCLHRRSDSAAQQHPLPLVGGGDPDLSNMHNEHSVWGQGNNSCNLTPHTVTMTVNNNQELKMDLPVVTTFKTKLRQFLWNDTA